MAATIGVLMASACLLWRRTRSKVLLSALCTCAVLTLAAAVLVRVLVRVVRCKHRCCSFSDCCSSSAACLVLQLSSFLYKVFARGTTPQRYVVTTKISAADISGDATAVVVVAPCLPVYPWYIRLVSPAWYPALSYFYFITHRGQVLARSRRVGESAKLLNKPQFCTRHKC